MDKVNIKEIVSVDGFPRVWITFEGYTQGMECMRRDKAVYDDAIGQLKRYYTFRRRLKEKTKVWWRLLHKTLGI